MNVLCVRGRVGADARGRRKNKRLQAKGEITGRVLQGVKTLPPNAFSAHSKAHIQQQTLGRVVEGVGHTEGGLLHTCTAQHLSGPRHAIHATPSTYLLHPSWLWTLGLSPQLIPKIC
jgi:hypothetical protein